MIRAAKNKIRINVSKFDEEAEPSKESTDNTSREKFYLIFVINMRFQD